VLLGGLLIIGLAGNDAFNKVILVIAITFGTINIVGGFLVTDRMLEMFKSKPKPARDEDTDRPAQPSEQPPVVAPAGGREPAERGGEAP